MSSGVHLNKIEHKLQVMDRNPPPNVKRILRKEVNYGCPVPNCGSPFLSWHHFDPPWSVKEHHNPEGMIALCTQCHPMADSGAFSPAQLRCFKQNPNPIEFVKAKFPWMPENCIIRLGGCYAQDWCRISISGEPILEIRKDKVGLTTINFVLKNESNEILATMHENVFHALNDSIHDLAISASANRIKIWSEERCIGLEFHYSRMSATEIEKYIQKDTPVMPDFVGQPVPIENLKEFYIELSQIKDFMPEVAAIGYRRNDPVGTAVRWHVARHMGEDGRIPLLDFISCRFFHAKQCNELRNGRLGGLEFCGGNTFSF